MSRKPPGRTGRRRYFRPADAGSRRTWPPSKPAAILLVISGFSLLVLMAAVFGQQGLLKVRALEKEKDDLEARVGVLQERTRRLRSEVREMQTDPYLYEKLARERLGLVKPGEVVYDFRREPFPDSP